MIPELVYSTFLRAKGRPPYWRSYFADKGVASVSVVTTIVLPDDVDAIIWAMAAEARAGAGQTCTRMELSGLVPVGSTGTLFKSEYGTAAQNRSFYRDEVLWLPRSSSVTFVGGYNAAVQVNYQFLYLTVLHVPPMDV